MAKLVYYSSSNTSVYTPDPNNSAFTIFSNTSSSISADTYNSSGGTFVGTVGTLRINLISGSQVLLSLPYDQVDFHVSPSSYFPTTVGDVAMRYSHIISDGSNYDSSYYFKIVNSSSLQEVINEGIFPLSPVLSGTSITSSQKYNINLYSGNNKTNIISVYNDSGSLVLSSSWIGTSSYGITLNPTSSTYYSITAVVSQYCCSPFITSIKEISGGKVQIDYITGSCGGLGTGSYIMAEQSSDQTLWTLTVTSSYISSSLEFPESVLSSSITYHRLRAVCSGSYVSDSSNVLPYIY